MTKNQRGFTLIEVLVSIVMFGLIISSLPIAFMGFSRYNTAMELRTQAMSAAQFVLDEVRLIDPATLPNSGTVTETIPIDGRNFEVNLTYCNNATYCSANLRHLQVDVDFGTQLSVYSVETVFTKLQ